MSMQPLHVLKDSKGPDYLLASLEHLFEMFLLRSSPGLTLSPCQTPVPFRKHHGRRF